MNLNCCLILTTSLMLSSISFTKAYDCLVETMHYEDNSKQEIPCFTSDVGCTFKNTSKENCLLPSQPAIYKLLWFEADDSLILNIFWRPGQDATIPLTSGFLLNASMINSNHSKTIYYCFNNTLEFFNHSSAEFSYSFNLGEFDLVQAGNDPQPDIHIKVESLPLDLSHCDGIKRHSAEIDVAVCYDELDPDRYSPVRSNLTSCEMVIGDDEMFTFPLLAIILGFCLISIFVLLGCVWHIEKIKSVTTLICGYDEKEFSSKCDSQLSSLDTQVDSLGIKDVTKVLIHVFTEDKLFHDLFVAFAGFLQIELGFDVQLALWDEINAAESKIDWLHHAHQTSDKVVTVWTPASKTLWKTFGTSACEKSQNKNCDKDLFLSVIRNIRRDMFQNKNRSKYSYVYFNEVCSFEDCIPLFPAEIDTPVVFKLIENFDGLFFWLRGEEMYGTDYKRSYEKVEVGNVFREEINPNYGHILQSAIQCASVHSQTKSLNNDGFMERKSASQFPLAPYRLVSNEHDINDHYIIGKSYSGDKNEYETNISDGTFYVTKDSTTFNKSRRSSLCSSSYNENVTNTPCMCHTKTGSTDLMCDHCPTDLLNNYSCSYDSHYYENGSTELLGVSEETHFIQTPLKGTTKADTFQPSYFQFDD